MLKTIIHIAIAASATMLLLPHLPGNAAGYLIYLSLSASILLAVQAILLLFTFRKKSPLWWIQATLFVATIATYGSNYLPTGPKQAPSDKKLRIISWNVENFQIKADTLKKAARHLNVLHADIICLQERPHDNLLHRDSIRAAFPEHLHFCTNDREDEVLNVAILSKYPLSNVATHYFDPGYNKMITADVATPHGTITLWNVHLQTTGGNPMQFVSNAQRRNEQAQELREKVRASKNPTIICGDFNDTPSSYTYRTLARGMHDSYTTAGNSLGGSYQPAGSLVRIDYILCSKQLQPTDYRLQGNPWSDHKIQVAEIAYK